jgi:hypothetical protein
LSSTAIELGISTSGAPDPETPGPAESSDPTAIAELANPPATAPTGAPVGGGDDDMSFPAINPGIDALLPGVTGALRFPAPKDNVPGAANIVKFPSPPAVPFPPDPGGAGNMLGGSAGNGSDIVCC